MIVIGYTIDAATQLDKKKIRKTLDKATQAIRTFCLSARALCSKMLVIWVTVLMGFPMSTGRGVACPLSFAAGSNLLRSSLTYIPEKRQRNDRTYK